MQVKTLDEYFRDWEKHVFGFGYGSGEQYVIPALKRLMAAIPYINGEYDHKTLEKAVGAPVAWLLINTLCHADIFEYGTSPRFGWLTPQGRSLKDYFDSNTEDFLVRVLDDMEGTYCYPDACNCGPDGYEAGKVCANPFFGGGAK
jgi:hypothetical protein